MRDAAAMLPTPFALAVQAENTPSIQAIFDYAADRMVGQSVALVGDAALLLDPIPRWELRRRLQMQFPCNETWCGQAHFGRV